ncbi:MAG: hypothetical protein AAFX03_00930 [Pseudomonadota bacterium]
MIASQVISAISAVLTAMIVWRVKDQLRRKPDLFWNVLPRASFLIPTQEQGHPPSQVHSEVVILQNLGGETAEDCEVVLSFRPMDWQLRVVPNRNFGVETIAEGHCTLRLGNLGPQELLQIHVHYVDQGPQIIQVRTNDGLVFPGKLLITRVIPEWTRRLNLTLQIVGLFFAILFGVTAAAAIIPLFVDAISNWVMRLNEGA